MNDTLNNIYIDKTLGLFIGPLLANKLHSHYAFQISVSGLDYLILTNRNDEEFKGSGFFINSRVLHKLQSETLQLTVLINPLSPLGHKLYLYFGKEDISILTEELYVPLNKILDSYLKAQISFGDFVKQLKEIFSAFEGRGADSALLREDQRIFKALKYLDQNFDRVVSLREVTSLCALSETRFLHLFKEQTNLNFRRFHLWNRLIKSIPHLQKLSITQTAHMFGFTDSAHYSRTFTETFGLTPKYLKSKE